MQQNVCILYVYWENIHTYSCMYVDTLTYTLIYVYKYVHIHKNRQEDRRTHTCVCMCLSVCVYVSFCVLFMLNQINFFLLFFTKYNQSSQKKITGFLCKSWERVMYHRPVLPPVRRSVCSSHFVDTDLPAWSYMMVWFFMFFFFKYLLLHVPSSMNGLSHTRTETVRDCKRKKKTKTFICYWFIFQVIWFFSRQFFFSRAVNALYGRLFLLSVFYSVEEVFFKEWRKNAKGN